MGTTVGDVEQFSITKQKEYVVEYALCLIEVCGDRDLLELTEIPRVVEDLASERGINEPDKLVEYRNFYLNRFIRCDIPSVEDFISMQAFSFLLDLTYLRSTDKFGDFRSVAEVLDDGEVSNTMALINSARMSNEEPGKFVEELLRYCRDCIGLWYAKYDGTGKYNHTDDLYLLVKSCSKLITQIYPGYEVERLFYRPTSLVEQARAVNPGFQD